MSDKIVKFKTRVFGGFDQRDVVSYLKSISAERNSLRDEIAVLRERERGMTEELERLGTLELSSLVIEEASDILAKLEERHASIGEHISELRRHFDAVRGDAD